MYKKESNIIYVIILGVIASVLILGGVQKLGLESIENRLKRKQVQDKEIKVITMFSEDVIVNEDNFSSPVAQAITEATGVRLEIQSPVGEVRKKLDVMVASGDYPDLIVAKDTAQLVDAGAYIDLTPLIMEYGENLQRLYGNMDGLRYSKEDSGIYILPIEPVDDIPYFPETGFMLQHDVVKELGYPKLETVYDFENAIRTYMEMYPEIDGQPTIGISLVVDDWRWLIGLGNPASFATGAPDDGQWYIDPDTYQAQYKFLREDIKEYYKWLNHMYNTGLIDPDSFVQKHDAYESKIASGRVLGLIDTRWQYIHAEQILRSKGKPERTYGLYPIQMDSTTSAQTYRDTGNLTGYGIGISTTCENPELVIQFLDYLASDEGHVLRHWGIEGQNYYVDDTGRRIIPEEEMERRRNDSSYAKETGVGVYIYPFPTWGTGVLDDKGNSYVVETKENVIEGYSEIEKEVLEAYGAKTWADLYPAKEEIKPSDWGSAWAIPIPADSGITPMLRQCDEIAKDGLIRAIVAKPEEFDLYWDRMIEDLENAGVYELNEKFTELVKEKVEILQE